MVIVIIIKIKKIIKRTKLKNWFQFIIWKCTIEIKLKNNNNSWNINNNSIIGIAKNNKMNKIII